MISNSFKFRGKCFLGKIISLEVLTRFLGKIFSIQPNTAFNITLSSIGMMKATHAYSKASDKLTTQQTWN